MRQALKSIVKATAVTVAIAVSFTACGQLEGMLQNKGTAKLKVTAKLSSVDTGMMNKFGPERKDVKKVKVKAIWGASQSVGPQLCTQNVINLDDWDCEVDNLPMDEPLTVEVIASDDFDDELYKNNDGQITITTPTHIMKTNLFSQRGVKDYEDYAPVALSLNFGVATAVMGEPLSITLTVKDDDVEDISIYFKSLFGGWFNVTPAIPLGTEINRPAASLVAHAKGGSSSITVDYYPAVKGVPPVAYTDKLIISLKDEGGIQTQFPFTIQVLPPSSLVTANDVNFPPEVFGINAIVGMMTGSYDYYADATDDITAPELLQYDWNINGTVYSGRSVRNAIAPVIGTTISVKVTDEHGASSVYTMNWG